MKIKKLDESFECEHCKKLVPKLNYTTRDHCPYCLYSKHLDIIPGDRKSTCLGLLKPVGYVVKKKGEQIVYECEKCGYVHCNIIAEDDNRDLVIDLCSKPLKYDV